MLPLINFAQPISVLTATALFVLVLILARETKKSIIPAIMLGVYVIMIICHSVEFSVVNPSMTLLQATLAKCIAYDFIFIFLSFALFLWIDDIQTKENKSKSIDDSLSWFWKKV